MTPKTPDDIVFGQSYVSFEIGQEQVLRNYFEDAGFAATPIAQI